MEVKGKLMNSPVCGGGEGRGGVREGVQTVSPGTVYVAAVWILFHASIPGVAWVVSLVVVPCICGSCRIVVLLDVALSDATPTSLSPLGGRSLC